MHLFVFSLFFIPLLVIVHGVTVIYVDNPACSTSSGCDFNSTIWNATTINEGDNVIINSDVPITITLSNSSLSLSLLHFGLVGSPVTLVVHNSSIFFTVNTSVVENNVWWGKESILVVSNSTVEADSINGGSMNITNRGEFNAINGIQIEKIYAESQSVVGAEYGSIDYLDLQDSYFVTTQQLNVTFLNANNSTFFASLQIGDYGLVRNSSIYPDIILLDNSTIVLNDSKLTITELTLGTGSLFSFHSSDPNNGLKIFTINSRKQGAETHLGDNVRAEIQSGRCVNLTLGNNVNLRLGAEIYVDNIQQLDSGSFASITIAGLVQLSNSVPINASIFLSSSPRALLQLSSFSLVSGNFIRGIGSIISSGQIFCPGSFISVDTVYLTNANITVDTLTANQMNQYINSIYRMYINGNFVLSSNKIELGSSILYVSGNYSQIGGYIQVDINDVVPANTSRVQAGGLVSLEGVEVRTTIGNTVNRIPHLLMSSLSKQLNATGISSFIWMTLNSSDAFVSATLSTQTPGELYLVPKDPIIIPTKEETTWDKFWPLFLAIIIIGGVVAIIGIIYIITKVHGKKYNTL